MIETIYVFLLDKSGDIQLMTSALLIVASLLSLRTQKKWLARYNAELAQMRKMDQLFKELIEVKEKELQELRDDK